MKYEPGKRDWTRDELQHYFTFNPDLATSDPDSIYFGELITLYNPNIPRETIEVIPEHTEVKPSPTAGQLEDLRNLLASDLSLEANRYIIKQVKPPSN